MDSFYGLQLYHFLALPRAALCLYPLLALHRAALSVIRAAPCGSICLSLDLFIRTRCAEQRDLLHYNDPVSPDHHHFVGCGKYCGNYHMLTTFSFFELDHSSYLESAPGKCQPLVVVEALVVLVRTNR